MRAFLSAHQAPADDCTSEVVPASQRRPLDVAPLASIAGLHGTRGHIPLNRCVPIRTWKEVPATITRDEIYMLLYVDGELSLEQIGVETGMALPETVSVFFKLLSHGLVEIAGEQSPDSQLVAKYENERLSITDEGRPTDVDGYPGHLTRA